MGPLHARKQEAHACLCVALLSWAELAVGWEVPCFPSACRAYSSPCMRVRAWQGSWPHKSVASLFLVFSEPQGHLHHQVLDALKLLAQPAVGPLRMGTCIHMWVVEVCGVSRA